MPNAAIQLQNPPPERFSEDITNDRNRNRAGWYRTASNWQKAMDNRQFEHPQRSYVTKKEAYISNL